MNKDKLRQQAQVLRRKKLSRIMIAKQRPTVEEGVVKFNAPIVDKATNIRTFSPIPVPNKARSSILSPSSSTPNISPETINSYQNVRKSKGCAGCRRNKR